MTRSPYSPPQNDDTRDTKNLDYPYSCSMACGVLAMVGFFIGLSVPHALFATFLAIPAVLSGALALRTRNTIALQINVTICVLICLQLPTVISALVSLKLV